MRGSKRIGLILIVLAVLAVVAATLLGGNGADSTNNTAKTPPASPQVKQQFTLTGHGQLPTASQYVRKGVLNSQGLATPQLGYDGSVALGQRYRSDSPSSAPRGATNVAKFKDVAAKIYQDPIVGYTYGNMLCRMTFGDWSVGDHNPWLKDAGACKDNSFTLVHKALPYWWANSTAKNQKAAMGAWKRYEAYASRVVTLLNNMHMVGVVQHPVSVQNWHLIGSGMIAGNRFPVAGLSPTQENLPALVLTVVNKGQSCEQARVGINLKDSRPEVFTPQGCKVPPRKTTTTPKTPKTPSHPTTPSTPKHPNGGCTTNCTTTHHGCTSNCGKGGCTTNCTTVHHGCKYYGTCQTPHHGCTSNCGKGGCTTNCTTPPKCTPVALPDNRYEYTDSTHCHIKKKPQSFDQQQNGSPADQPVQDNKTSGVNTGPTKGAPKNPPSNNDVNKGDTNPTKNGSNSGSSDGSGTPSGGGSDGSGGTTSDNPPADTGQGGTGNGDGGGTIVDP